ncbi:hypothetical protein U9M48_040062 [Paspalum notatum var. saurae]|uniref:Reverse transcriptase Ty1/copia-type domain-containing protein n=1 Tax=Paspalum notatum var. saurae TaxID=547442 RepID=A0AAQ3UQ64_PASNO
MDNELFICQVYVDDIIFGSTNEEYCKGFGKMLCRLRSDTTVTSSQPSLNYKASPKMMAKEFEMSMIGELTFFLGFQIK